MVTEADLSGRTLPWFPLIDSPEGLVIAERCPNPGFARYLYRAAPLDGEIFWYLPPAAQTPALAGLVNSILPPWPPSSTDELGSQEMSDSTTVLGQRDEKQESDPIRDCPNAPSHWPLLPTGKQRLGKERGVLVVLGLQLLFKEKNCTKLQGVWEKGEKVGGGGCSTAVDTGIVQGIRTPDLPQEPHAEFCQGGKKEEVSVSALQMDIFLCPKKCFVLLMLKAATQSWNAWPRNSDQQGNQENRMQSLPIFTSSTSLRLIAKFQKKCPLRITKKRNRVEKEYGWF